MATRRRRRRPHPRAMCSRGIRSRCGVLRAGAARDAAHAGEHMTARLDQDLVGRSTGLSRPPGSRRQPARRTRRVRVDRVVDVVEDLRSRMSAGVLCSRRGHLEMLSRLADRGRPRLLPQQLAVRTSRERGSEVRTLVLWSKAVGPFSIRLAHRSSSPCLATLSAALARCHSKSTQSSPFVRGVTTPWSLYAAKDFRVNVPRWIRSG
jgi:hypothetical protein